MSRNTIAGTALETLREGVRGEVLAPDDEGYDEARTIWNGKVDRRPAVIVRCSGTADVIRAVDVAREQDRLLSVKSGGHDVAGDAVCDDGVMIDLSPMDAVRVDPGANTVRVQGGATWGDLNHETRAFGLETVGMPYDDVGVGGFTLGGGMSYLSRQYGLAIDNLRAADVVTAGGELVHASEDENSDLFWALRGGSGNFGVVTSFEFDCLEVDLEAVSGQFLYPLEDAVDVLRFYREFAAEMPEETVAGTGLLEIPSTPQFPAELHGETAVLVMANHMGDVEVGKRVLQQLEEFGDPLLDVVRTESYSELGATELARGQRNHWKNHYVADLSDEAIETLVERSIPRPTPDAHVALFSLGGAINRVDAGATAYPHRDADHLLEIVTQWSDPEDDDEVVSWARDLHQAMAPYATGGEYVNNQTEGGSERARAAYGENYDRLVEVKNRWDPENRFRWNQNVEPTV